MKIEYTKVGDYYLPNLYYPEEIRPIGCWGMLRKEYLKEHKSGTYTYLLLTARLDSYLADHPGEVDYIHDDDALIALAKQPNAIGFLLPAMGKEQLFKTVMADGVLPRKTFSMGHAQDKRYYIEARKIVK